MNPIRRYINWVDKVVESVLPDIIEGEIKAVRENRQAKDSRIVANGSSDNECDHEDEHPDIRASATSDVMPTNECRHVQFRMLKVFRGYQFIPNEYCPKCGEKL